ncbi:hypothetical protein BGW80DRAFT_141267 [Lactifluus volemus]|nr:hypothetical protein BGW80DRAFT_141267 [Lactifluus volemus]
MRHATPRRVQYTTSKVRYVGDYIAFTASQFVALSHAVVMRFRRNSVSESDVLLTYLVWERVLILTGHRHVRYVQYPSQHCTRRITNECFKHPHHFY